MSKLEIFAVCVLLIMTGAIISDVPFLEFFKGANLKEIIESFDFFIKPFFFLIATSLGIYLSYKKVGLDVKASFSTLAGQGLPMHVTDVTLLNDKDKTVIITRLYLLLETGEKLVLKDFAQSPLFIKPYETEKIFLPPTLKYFERGIKPQEFINAQIAISTDKAIYKCRNINAPLMDPDIAVITAESQNYEIAHLAWYKYKLTIYDKHRNEPFYIFIDDEGNLTNFILGTLQINNIQNLEGFTSFMKTFSFEKWTLHDIYQDKIVASS
ncbi:hypothetical protein ABMY35_01065 [Pseudoalteromonas sp. BZB3]|uniref:hypothetical protein n=1 Tax=Pseudoalteromonas sp. BZB3 TaxID=3136670 RepID=UPI0032C46A47